MNKDIINIANDALHSIEDENYTSHRNKVSGIVAKQTDSALLLDQNGDMQHMVNYTNQIKMNNESSSKTDISYEKNIITNRLNLVTDDITINGMKVNPQLYNMAGFVQDDEGRIQGHFNTVGTVLVKAWEPKLGEHGKYVYIRRYIRTPILFGQMTAPVIDDRFDIYNNNDNNGENIL